jgi:carboxylesterase
MCAARASAPIQLDGGPTGILLIHGFTGSPAEMRLVAAHLHERGLTVSVPCLPGHGTTVRRLNRTARQAWTRHVDRALADLQDRCHTVVVAGVSLGATLALQAASRRAVAGAVLYSPAILVTDWRACLLPVLMRLAPMLPKGRDYFADPEAAVQVCSYDATPLVAAHEVVQLIGQVQLLLSQVRCPLLIVQSAADRTIDRRSAVYLAERAGSARKEVLWLRDSGHMVTVDCEWRTVAEATYRFVQQVNVRL